MKIICNALIILMLTTFSMSVKAQDYQIRLVEFHGEALGNIPQLGLGANITMGKEFLGGILEYNYRKIDLDKLVAPGTGYAAVSEFYFGLRYYSMKPNFMAGNVAIRPTFGAMYGFDMEPSWRALLFAGVAISPVTSTSGITLNFVYRPKALPASGHLIEPLWIIRLGILLGPSFNG